MVAIPNAGAPDISGRIRLAAAHANLLPSDPLWPVVSAISDIPSEVDKRLAPIITALSELTASAKIARDHSLSNTQVDEISNQILSGCQGWTASFVKASHWQNYTLLVLAFITVASFFFGAGWMMHPVAPKMTCADQTTGTRVCWVFTSASGQVAKK